MVTAGYLGPIGDPLQSKPLGHLLINVLKARDAEMPDPFVCEVMWDTRLIWNGREPWNIPAPKPTEDSPKGGGRGKARAVSDPGVGDAIDAIASRM